MLQRGEASSPWTRLGPRRFGGDAYERLVTFQYDSASEGPGISVHLKFVTPDSVDIRVATSTSETVFPGVAATLNAPSIVKSTLSGQQLVTTVVSQPPAPIGPGSALAGEERLHVFHNGQRTILRVPVPEWLRALGDSTEAAAASKSGGSVRAPMPSLVVDVRVKEGEKVEKGAPLVVLESMKTETVLRAGVAGVVGVVGCKKGEMGEEGRVLIEIKDEESNA